MGVIRWEEPPPVRNGIAYDWAAIGSSLSGNPGEWALVAVCPNSPTAGSTARFIREGKYLELARLGRFEAVARTIDGEARVYARYVGEA